MRTLLLGIDAAAERVLDPLFADGALPNLRGLFARGAAGPLESQIPPWTASAWPSLYTGVNPGKHGVFGFLHFDGYDWRVVHGADVAARPLWEFADHRGLSSVVVNVPVTNPPRAFDGALIPGYVAPEDPPCHPEGILADVREAVGGYRVYADESTPVPERYLRPVEMRGAAFRYLADRFDPDFGFVQFQQTDAVFHRHPDEEGVVRAVYEAVDEEVGAILEACEPATVIVASDHGIGPYGGYEFRVNEYLRERGFVETTSAGRGMPTWAGVRDDRLKAGATDADDASDADGTVERVLGGLSRIGVTSQRVAAALDRVGLAEAVAEHVPTSVARAGSTRVDFAASKAYARSRIELGVRINLAGREPEGVVPADEYERVREELIATLAAAETPDGDPVFEAVERREEVFEGPYADRAVDVITVPSAFDQFLSTTVGRGTFGPPSETYNHKREGVVAVTGTGVDVAAGVEGAHLFDVAPTVLATLGIPADERMDGRVLPPIEPVGRRVYPDYDREEGAPDSDRAVERRLADLGYIER